MTRHNLIVGLWSGDLDVAPFPYMDAILDSITSHIAVLDRAGTIIAVNEAWRRFGRENGFSAPCDGIGLNYLHACWSCACDDVDGPAAGIQAVLEGKRDVYEFEYPCHGPNEQRWFLLRVTAIGDDLLRHVVVCHDNVTERKLGEIELRASDHLYRSLLSHVPGNVYLADPGDPAKIIYRFVRDGPTLGFAQHKWTADPCFWASRLHPDDREAVAANDRHAVETGEPFAIECRYLTKDGETVWVRDSARLICDETGTPLHWLGIALNVTEQKQVGLALRQSEGHFRSAFDDASVASAIISLDDRYVRVNTPYCELFGVSPDEMQSFNINDLIHPDERGQAWDERAALLSGAIPRYQVERRLRRPDGRLIHALIGVSLFYDYDGETYLLSQIQDITERMAVEEELREATETLQAVFRASPIAIMVTDLDNRVIEWNPTAERLFGWTAEEVLGCPVPTVPDSDTEVSDIRSRVQSGEVINDVQVQRKHKDGTLLDVSLSGAPIHSADGSVRGAMALYIDLRAQKAAEEVRTRRDRVLGMVSGTIGLREILNTLCDLVETEVPGTQASIVLLDDTGESIRHAAGTNLPEAYLRAMDGSPIGPLAGSCGTAIFSGEPVIVADIETDPLWSNYRDIAGKFNLRSCWSVPILSDSNRAVGAFAVYSGEVRSPINDELEALRRASHLARIAIERKDADERIRASEEHFRGAFDSAATGMAFVSFDGEFLGVNPALCDMVGYSQEELVGGNYRDITHPEDISLSEMTGDMVSQGASRSVEFEKRYIHRDGHIVWVQMTSSVIRDDAGKPLYHITQMHDVSPRKRAEEALRQNEQRFRGVTQHATDIIGIIDWDMIIMYESPALETTLGYKVEDVLGRGCELMIHPDDVEQFVEAVEEVTAAPGNHVQRLIRYRHLDGSSRWLESTLTNLLDDPGVQGIVINSRDVTERLRAEVQMRESEERFRSAFDDASIGMLIQTLDGTILRVNQALCDLSGYTEDEFVGFHDEDFNYPDEPGIPGSVLDDLASGTIGSFRSERCFLHRNGSRIWAVVNVSVALDADGKPAYVVAQLQEITERKALEDDLQHQAYHDMLTGLPNRTMLLDRIRLATEDQHADDGQVGLLYLDLDNFKVVNDSLGHIAGDTLLQQLAVRLQTCVRDGDTVSRLGGDEFAILLRNLTSSAEAIEVAQRVIQEFEHPFNVLERLITASTSIGVVIAGHTSTAVDLMRQADIAMYRAKERGRNRIELFDAAMHEDAVRRLELENDLRRAISDGEFIVYYQPKVDMLRNKAYALEALVRWNHPKRGLVLPDEFIPLAEETGLILPLGRYVLREASRHGRELIDAGLLPADGCMVVNLSARQFIQPDLVDEISEILAETGLKASQLEIEVTETVLMDDVEGAVVRLEALSALGLGIAIDDFGTGYSSLSYLTRFPVSVIKIDRPFVSQLGISKADTAIVTAIISLADALGIHSVAEGVETAGQLDHLARLGCHHAQGFYFSRPVPPGELEELLRAGMFAPAAAV